MEVLPGSTRIISNAETYSGIRAGGILPRYYDSAPNIIITNPSVLKIDYYHWTSCPIAQDIPTTTYASKNKDKKANVPKFRSKKGAVAAK